MVASGTAGVINKKFEFFAGATCVYKLPKLLGSYHQINSEFMIKSRNKKTENLGPPKRAKSFRGLKQIVSKNGVNLEDGDWHKFNYH